MPQLIVRLMIWGLVIAATFALRFGLLFLTDDEGEPGFWLGAIVLVAVTTWSCSALSRRYVALAAALGASLGWVYFQIEWAFDRAVLVDVLHRFTEDSITWLATGLTLVQWPIITICCVAGGIAAWGGQSDR